jgi:hypothetical protein
MVLSEVKFRLLKVGSGILLQAEATAYADDVDELLLLLCFY